MSEGWGPYLIYFGLKTHTKVMLNIAIPGSGAIVDFGEAAKDLYSGDRVSCVLNILSGCAEIATAGIYGTVKEAVQGGAKKAVVDAAKKTAAKETTKAATKEIGNKLGQEISKGLLSEAAEEAMRKGAKETAQSTLLNFLMANPLDKDIFKEVLESLFADGTEKVFVELTKGGSKNFCPVLMEIATKGAKEELQKHLSTLLAAEGLAESLKSLVKNARY